MKEDNGMPFADWYGVYEYQDPAGPTLLSSNFVAVFPEVASVLNCRVEHIVILNDITQDNKHPGRLDHQNCQVY